MDDDRKKTPRREGGDRKTRDAKSSGGRAPAKPRAGAAQGEAGDGRERIAKRLARAGVGAGNKEKRPRC
jgi:hypothetical protein